MSRRSRRGLTPHRNFPLRDDFFQPFREVFDDFWNDFFKTSSLGDRAKAKSGYPRIEDGFEDDTWIVRASIPGVKPEDLEIDVIDVGDKNTFGCDIQDTIHQKVRIAGKMAEEYQSPKDSEYYHRELRKSAFIREINLPIGIKGEPEAKLKNGVLTLKWPLPEKGEGEGENWKRIKVQAGE